MNIIITILVTAIVVGTWVQLYNAKVIRPVDEEQNENLLKVWTDFITANIDSSFTIDHCHTCAELIKLFISRFKSEQHISIINENLESMWNRLDLKYQSIKYQELSETTSDHLIQ
jgi:hypothetical protein